MEASPQKDAVISGSWANATGSTVFTGDRNVVGVQQGATLHEFVILPAELQVIRAPRAT